MNYYNLLDNERKRLEEHIAKKESFIQKAPKGILGCYPNGDCWRWYVIEYGVEKNGSDTTEINGIIDNNSHSKSEHNIVNNPENKPENNLGKTLENNSEVIDHSISNNKKTRRKYLPKTEEETAMTLALKGLYEKELLDDKQELRAINMYLKNCSSFERGNKYVERVSEFSRLLSEHYEIQHRAKSEYIDKWLADKYTGPVPHPEELKVPTRAGFKVRSKSERDIIRLLMEHEIPFKYEQHMKYGNEDLYPDFTILNPTTGKVFLWEHNGIMDKEGYAMKKLKEEGYYYKLGYVRGKNMIVTYEQRNEGIDEKEAEFIIHHLILQDDIY